MMEQYIEKDGKRLRLGYTTGSCAAAAAKAAAWMLLTNSRKETITLDTPKGIRLNLDVKEIQIGENSVSCAIEKDSGDDPDITNGILVSSKVTLLPDSSEIIIEGGKGVGKVTKGGLDQPVGMSAINSVPRKMIKDSLNELAMQYNYKGGFHVLISVPKGEDERSHTVRKH